MQLEEARLNTHQLHEEDLILEGIEGIREFNQHVVDFLENKAKITYKIDGAPAVVLWHRLNGYPDNSICLKSFVNGAKNSMSSVDDIVNKYKERPLMCKMLIYCLELAKCVPEGEAWQGDCLFTQDNKKEYDEDGDTYISFKANKINYAFKKGSPDYKQVKNASFGISFHTIYEVGATVSQRFDVNTNVLNAPSNFYFLQNAVDYDGNSEKVKKLFDLLLPLEERLLDNNDYVDLVTNDAFRNYWDKFENKNLSDKKQITLNIDSLETDILSYVTSENNRLKTNEINKKREKGSQDGRSPEAIEKSVSTIENKYNKELQELTTLIEDNKKLLSDIVLTLNAAAKVKMEMLKPLPKSDKYTTHFMSRTKGKIPTDGEGYSISDKDGNIVKLVDRSTFSNANRDPDILGLGEN